MNLIKVKCVFCGKAFLRQKGRFNEAKKFGWKTYCSRKCEYQHKDKRQTLACENCGKSFLRQPSDFSPRNYCSSSCAAKVNNRKFLKRKAKFKTCTECGKQYKKSTNNIKYCSLPCRRKSEQRTPEELIKIIKETAKKLGRIPARRELLKGIDKACVKSFGSWNKAVTAAGFQPNRSHSQRMYKRANAKAIDGHLCDSISELLVDNWLYKNDISHERDAHYPETHHKADWIIKLEGENIFVEYFGLANDSPRYDRAIKEKKNLCRKYGLKLIAILPQDLYPKEFLEENLKNKLKKFLVA